MQPRKLFRACLIALLVSSLTSCTTLLDGRAVKAPHDINADGADLNVLDPGNYPTVPRPPMGTANSDNIGTILEGHRMANNVVVPSDVDNTLTKALSMNILIMQRERGITLDLPDPGQTIVSAHHLLAGFSTARRDEANQKGLINLVLRFPDPGAAADAAHQLATQVLIPNIPTPPLPIPRHPDALGSTYTDNGVAAVQAYLPHGPYLLYAWARSPQGPDGAAGLVATTFDKQIPLIDKFVPTDAAKLRDLPIDSVGFLSRVLPADKTEAGDVNLGGYQAYAALHFQDNPISAAADFKAAGVDAVATLKTTVYRARDAASAKGLQDASVREAAARPGAKPAAGVAGLPFAKCFEFTQNDQDPGPPFGCFARAGRYQFEAWSQEEADVHQQIASQYLMLIS